MAKKSIFLGLLTILIAFSFVATQASQTPYSKAKAPNLDIAKMRMERQGIRPDMDNFYVPQQQFQRPPLGSATFRDPGTTHPSPGVKVGYTYYEYQHNQRMTRQIGWGPHPPYGDLYTEDGAGFVHFEWMYSPDAAYSDRAYAYNYYNFGPGYGVLGSFIRVQEASNAYAGYVTLDVAPDGRAVPGGHNNYTGAGYNPYMYFDESAGFGSFADGEVSIPAEVVEPCLTENEPANTTWPSISYQEGTQNVLHVISDCSPPDVIQYFRIIDPENETSEWEDVWCVDTIGNLGYTVVASNITDKVALVWSGPDTKGGCDTCSNYDLTNWGDDDIYYQISEDQGATWNNRVNLTKAPEEGAAWRCSGDLQAMIDSNDKLHIAWAAMLWPDAAAGAGYWLDSRLLHWSEAFDDVENPTPYVRTVADATYGDLWNTYNNYQGIECMASNSDINIFKVMISECDGKFYCLWGQVHDKQNDIYDDCAAWHTSGAWGSANGDLWFSVSTDDGLTWDMSRNLTHTYTPDCDPDPASGLPECQSEYWPTMARYGRANQIDEDWSGAYVIDPDSAEDGYTGSPNDGLYHYLDVMYILDLEAGAGIWAEGDVWNDSMMWFRFACVEPIPAPQFLPSFWAHAHPAWTHPGMPIDTPLTIENSGNVLLTYDIAIDEGNGPEGWLTVGGFTGSVPSGFGNSETGTVYMDPGPARDVYAYYSGTLTFTGRTPETTAPSSPDVITIKLLVCDTVHFPVIDTVETACIALPISSDGGFGLEPTAEYSMDWQNAPGELADCDPAGAPYLYDGSPIIGWIEDLGGGEADTVFFWNCYDNTWLSQGGFRPIGGHLESSLCDPSYMVFQTGEFTIYDSSMGMQEIWIAPQDLENCGFIIQVIKVWSEDGETHPDVIVGDGIDWDVPCDSGYWYNTGGVDDTRNMVYQQGIEYDVSPEADCQEMDARFAGTAFIESRLNGDIRRSREDGPYSAYVESNDTYIYPASNFVPRQLYELFLTEGYSLGDQTEDQDRHTGMCFEPGLTFEDGDTLAVFAILATVGNGTLADLQATIDLAFDWYDSFAARKDMTSLLDDSDGDNIIDNCDNFPDCYNPDQAPCGGCCIVPGDVAPYGAEDGVSDISDLVFLVEYNFKDGTAPDCEDAADVAPLGNLDGVSDISDLVFLVEYNFKDGPPPNPCAK